MPDIEVLSKEEMIIEKKDQRIAELESEIDDLKNGQKPMQFNWASFWVTVITIGIAVVYAILGNFIPGLFDEAFVVLLLAVLNGFLTAHGIHIKKNQNTK